MQKITSTKLFRVTLVAALFLLLIFLNPARIFDPVRSGFNLVISPFQRFFYALSVDFAGAKEFFGSIGRLNQENEKLIEKISNS